MSMETESDAFEAYMKRYEYAFPQELIASTGAEPRESARLLVHDRTTNATELTHFSDLATFLPKGTLLVLNDTKVFPARVQITTPRGRTYPMTIVAYRDGEFDALIPRPLRVGSTVTGAGTTFTILRRNEKVTTFGMAELREEFRIRLERFGSTPLPPYITETPLTEDSLRTRYQSIFAKHEGSSAAPTASLHFSDPLLTSLAQHGVEVCYVTLHVGPGTFLPVIDTNFFSKQLHTEEYNIPETVAEHIARAKEEGRAVIPIGTTALRALESAADESGALTLLSGSTSLFIQPGYRFRVADGLITNFHVPRSSLLMLVDAMLQGQSSWRELYDRAIVERFRLFSFGDGMLIR